ncbi:GATA zinc finger domain-containing protein 10 [Fusarium oxysporum f. sp. albedinis]|nr:GATA zinc finger domain-containing protein 10 [Fusarium oxysporum f. sp. albedinis]
MSSIRILEETTPMTGRVPERNTNTVAEGHISVHFSNLKGSVPMESLHLLREIPVSDQYHSIAHSALSVPL